MNDIFSYEWHENTRRNRLTARLVLQAIVLAVIVGFGPDLLFLLIGYDSDLYIYQLCFMSIVIPVIIVTSVLSCYNSSITDVTTSSLVMKENTVKVTRHVTAETGRRFIATWDSLEIIAYKVDEFHRVIQIDAKWKASAYRVKRNRHARSSSDKFQYIQGSFVDSDIRSHPQTFQFTPESFYKATAYLERNCFEMMTEMTAEEYEKAKPFIHKHYEI